MRTIAYIAPELTAPSESFVYQEVYALEALGYRVLPFALTRTRRPARDAHDIACRTTILQDGSRLLRGLRGIAACGFFGARRATTALHTLVTDMHKVGWLRGATWSLPGQWLAGARMARQLAEAGCDHIHAHFASAPAQVAMYASVFGGIAFTCTAHVHDILGNGVLLAEKAARARRLLTISHYNRALLISLGIDPKRIDVVRCTPDVPEVAPSPFGSRRTVYRIGTMGRLAERRGMDDLIRAVALLVRSGCPPIKLQIVGEGAERLRLQSLVDELRVARQVEFLGSLPPANVTGWLATLDLFVAACKSDRRGGVDGIPVELMEAMGMGVPVVSTRIAGVPELVIDGQTGSLAEPGDPASLADVIGHVMVDPDRARMHARAARAHVRWEFGRSINLHRLVRHFSETPADVTVAESLEEAA